MSDQTNPYASGDVPADGAATQRWKNVIMLLLVVVAGNAFGTYISAELLYFHFPEERVSSQVLSNAIEAFVASPLAMSVGIFPTLGFYGSHGFLVIPEIILAVLGLAGFVKTGRPWWLVCCFLGFALWSHNNYLGFHALMSV